MRVHRMEVEAYLRFTSEERDRMFSSFALGDAEEQLSYAVATFGSKRVADLVVTADNSDIGVLALTEVDGFAAEDGVRIQEMCKAHDRHVSTCRCVACAHVYRREFNLYCPKCLQPQR